MSDFDAGLDRSVRLSDNFYLYEFDCRDGTPVPDELCPGLKTFAGYIQTMRTFIGAPITILSGYRHDAYNQRIGGAKRSYHVYDKRPGKYAVDMVPRGLQPAAFKEMIEGLIRLDLVPDGGLGLYDKWVHYDTGPRRRWVG